MRNRLTNSFSIQGSLVFHSLLLYFIAVLRSVHQMNIVSRAELYFYHDLS